MGCDIHTVIEILDDGKWRSSDADDAFDCRNYGLFGFLADVRNYSHIPPLAKPRGYPLDASDEVKHLDPYWGPGGHSSSYVTLKELEEFDYNQVFKDRRCSVTVGNYTNGAALCPEDIAQTRTYREFLGEWYFKEIQRLKELSRGRPLRVVFCFDN